MLKCLAADGKDNIILVIKRPDRLYGLFNLNCLEVLLQTTEYTQ
jgi:hypothetical protein